MHLRPSIRERAGRRIRLVAVVGAVLGLGLVGAVPAGAHPSMPATHRRARHGRRVCGRPSGLVASCRSVELSADGVSPLASTTPAPGSYGPGILASAYKFSLPAPGSAWVWNGRTVAIVDAMDNPRTATDLAVYRTRYHLPPCTVASGCFRKVNENGAASPLPAGDVNWGKEIDLDIEMVSAVCPQCRIRLVEAASASLFDLVTAEDRAATMNASAISNSWGSTGELGALGPLLFDSYFDHPGIAIAAASGDGGYGGSWPSDVPTVIAVGGTSLTRATNARGWNESVWSGGGSWCSDVDSQSAWQTAAVQQTATATQSATCTTRTSTDVSAVADPHTGVAAYDSYGSTGGANWYVFGGTSVATPIIASMYARAGDHIHDAANPYPARATYNAWYANHAVLNDPTTGTNGVCGTDPVYMCNGEPGYDAPTGLGTPNGLSAF